MKYNRLLTLSTLLALSTLGSNLFAGTKNFPFYANQLQAGERFYAPKHKPGSQGHGFDITMVKKRSNGKWYHNKSGTDGSKNSHSVIYGKKFYAISSGVVFRCWRNAPENPKPGVHHQYVGKRMPGGGNQIWVKQDDGKRVLYAHAQPGSIPASICPKSASLYSKEGAKTEADVPVSQQVRVKAGQYLGRVGNAGHSSGPHLHIHIVSATGSTPIPIQWQRGLATSASKTSSGYKINLEADWYKLNGKTIPASKPVIWPPFKKTGTLTINNVLAKNYDRFFQHSAISGFRPTMLKNVTRNGKLRIDSKWAPANNAWLAWYGLDKSKRDQKQAEAKSKGFRKTWEWYTTYKNKKYYSMVFIK